MSIERKEQEGSSSCQEDKPRPFGFGSGLFVLLIANIIISSLVCFCSIKYYDTKYATKIVSYDLSGFLYDQKNLFSEEKISAEEMTENFDFMEEKLSSLPSNYAVILSEVTIKNVDELNVSR